MQNLQERKNRLADALEKERDNLPERNKLDGGINNKSIYEDCLIYLRTGVHPKYYNDNDLLYGCIEDIDMMFLDYEID